MGSLICFRFFCSVGFAGAFVLPADEFERLKRWMKLGEDRSEEAVPVYRREGGPGIQPSSSSTICMGFLSCDFNAKIVSYLWEH